MALVVIHKARWLRLVIVSIVTCVDQARHLWLIVVDMHLSADCGPDLTGCGADVDQAVFFQHSKGIKIN